jgi:hypothetical protein
MINNNKFKNLKNIFILKSLISVFLLSGILFVVFGQLVEAQILRPKTQTVTPQKKQVFKGAGAARPRPEFDKWRQLSFPAPLGAARLSAALSEVMKENGVSVMSGEMPLETYVVISSQMPYVAGKGSIDFVRPLMVDSRNNIVGFTEGGGGFELYFKPDRAGRWFLINCSVHAFQGGSFRIFGPDGTINESSITGPGNLQAFLVSQNAEWQKIAVDRLSGWWFLSSCQLTTPQIP